MASPDLDDGWLKYAHELDAALAVADFTKGARIVLREVFAQIFGPSKSRTAAISPTRVADRSGSKRELIARGLKELVDSLVLIPVSQEGPTRYAFAKDYETWLRADGRKASSGDRRLSETEVAYCKHATTVAYAYMYDAKEEPRSHPVTRRNQTDTDRSHPVTERSHPVTGNVTNGLRDEVEVPAAHQDDRNQMATENVTKLQSDESAPYRNGRAELKKEEEKTPPNPLKGVGGRVVVPVAEDDEPFAAPGTPAPGPIAPPVVNTPADIERVAAKAERLFPMLDFGPKVREVAGHVRMDHLDYALDEMHAGKKRDWRYLMGIVRRLVREGLPTDAERSSNGKPRAPDPPVEYHTAPLNSIWRQKAAQKIAKP